MKRISIVMLLSCVVFLSVFGCSDGVESEENSFLFRNGTTWSSTYNDVLLSEKNTEQIQMDNWKTIVVNDCAIGDFNYHLGYYFPTKKEAFQLNMGTPHKLLQMFPLSMIAYTGSSYKGSAEDGRYIDRSENEFNYLFELLSKKYGKAEINKPMQGLSVLQIKDPKELDLPIRLTGPSIEHPAGTDQFGRDVFSILVYNGQVGNNRINWNNACWTLNDDTLIVLLHVNVYSYDYICILYFNPLAISMDTVENDVLDML